MGWARHLDPHGREIGYAVDATCDEAGCEESIDRGLAYVCGGHHGGGERGCGRYFCAGHLFATYREHERDGMVWPELVASQVCGPCAHLALADPGLRVLG